MAVRTRLIALGAVLALAVVGCGEGGSNSDESVRVDKEVEFDPETTMAKLKAAGEIRIGVKYDQPNVGYRSSASEPPEGFDVEIAKIIAGRMGIEPGNITWVEAQSGDRESMLREGDVDLMVASYSITEDRLKEVGMAGPYYATGQQLLVRKGESDIAGPADIKGKRVCAAAGSTSMALLEKSYGAKPVPKKTYESCVNQLEAGKVDAVTTDGAILLGFAAEEPDKLEVVGEPFTSENYGVGYKHGDLEMCRFLTSSIKQTHRDGTWAEVLSRTLWKTTGGTSAPDVEPCP